MEYKLCKLRAYGLTYAVFLDFMLQSKKVELHNLARIKRDPKTVVALAQEIVKQFNPQTAQDADEVLKELFGPIFESLLQGEMENHLGYESNDKGCKPSQNRRNGYINKTVHTIKGDINIDVPRDRDTSFEPQIIPKRKKDISDIESKVLAMYARGISQRDISKTIEAINSSFRKVTKKGAFPNENALFKLLYLRSIELEKKWEGGHVQNWSMVLNQLMMNELFTSRIEKYLK